MIYCDNCGAAVPDPYRAERDAAVQAREAAEADASRHLAVMAACVEEERTKARGAEADNAALVEVLQWYAEESHYDPYGSGSPNEHGFYEMVSNDIWTDRGEYARDTLACRESPELHPGEALLRECERLRAAEAVAEAAHVWRDAEDEDADTEMGLFEAFLDALHAYEKGVRQ